MKVKVTAPSSLNEISLSQYQEYLSIEQPEPLDFLEIFLRLSKDILKKIPYKSALSAENDIKTMFDEDPKFHQRFYLNGVEYGFIPNLDKITHGEYLDITETIGDWEKIHVAMSVLYRPIVSKKKQKYLIEEYEPNKNISEIKSMPLGVCLGAIVFFYNLANELLKAIPNYLIQTEEQKKSSLKNGEDIIKYSQLLKVMSEGLTKLQPFHYTPI